MNDEYWANSIDKAIQQGMAEGQFDNLPGKGKPVNLGSNVFADPDKDLAYHVLQSAGYTLPWIQDGQEIDHELSTARDALHRAWEWCNHDHECPDWQRTLRTFRERMAAINHRIHSYNLKVPHIALQRPLVSADMEIEAMSGA